MRSLTRARALVPSAGVVSCAIAGTIYTTAHAVIIVLLIVTFMFLFYCPAKVTEPTSNIFLKFTFCITFSLPIPPPIRVSF
jgi:hypothetical protein